MALVTTKEMFEKAFKGGYAIGAFNINNRTGRCGCRKSTELRSYPAGI